MCCPSCREECTIRTSKSERNPGRSYIKCDGCGAFKFSDSESYCKNGTWVNPLADGTWRGDPFYKDWWNHMSYNPHPQ